MKKGLLNVIGMLMALFICLFTNQTVYASDGEYITISVEAEDDNGTLLYALDTDAPEAFSYSNEFSVPAGTSHTIYVKDGAGNITSQEYTPSSSYDNSLSTTEEGRNINIDVTLDDVPDYSDYEYAGDVLSDPAEAGQGTVYDKVETAAYDTDAERIFYTVTTDEGEVFYLVIDQGQSSNNVYLLDQVNLSDLRALAADSGNTGTTDTESSSSLLSALNGDGKEDEAAEFLDEETQTTQKKDNSLASKVILLLFIAAIGGGFYYYKNIYKNKKDEQMDLVDAPDKEDFEVDYEDDDDEVDFGLDDDYQEQIMKQLLEEDDEGDDDSNDNNDNNALDMSYPGEAEEQQEAQRENDGPEEASEDDEYDEELDAEEDDE